MTTYRIAVRMLRMYPPHAEDACAPEGVLEIPLLVPRVFKNPSPGNHYRAWLVTCELDKDVCSGHAERKRDLVTILTDPARRALWFKFAAECAERAGLFCTAATPASACHHTMREPSDPSLDGRRWGGPSSDWPCCGLPVRIYGGALALSQLRLGWTDERIAEARRPTSVRSYQGDIDYPVWLACWSRCREDLASGTVSQAELDAMGVPPEAAGYLRLTEGAREMLGRRCHPMNRAESLAAQDERSCWGR